MVARLLVVDDDASHRTMLKAVLSAEGYRIEEADHTFSNASWRSSVEQRTCEWLGTINVSREKW